MTLGRAPCNRKALAGGNRCRWMSEQCRVRHLRPLGIAQEIQMNDPKLAAQKFQDLVDLAKDATTDFEKAAVFAAAQALASLFDADEEDSSYDPYVLEKVEGVRWHISASLGYDVTNGHSASQHLSWARGDANSLRDQLERNQ